MLHVKSARSLMLAGLTAGGMVAGSANAALVLDFPGSLAPPVFDNGAGDSDPTPGTIVNSSFILGFGIAITVSQSNSPGTPAAGLLQVQSLDIQSFNPAQATLNIRAFDDGFLLPGIAGTPAELRSNLGGTFTHPGVDLGDSVVFQSFVNNLNITPLGTPALPPGTIVTGLQPHFSTGVLTESFSSNRMTPFVRGPVYSLANVATVTLSPSAQLNFSGTTAVIAVPEPVTGSLLTLAGLGLLSRRRKA